MTTLITGGSGFLGRGIMTYLDATEQYIVYSRDETKQDVCRQKFPYATFRLGDVKDLDLLTWTLRRYSVDTIIHAAAIKYIPEAEINVAECVSVNVDGSRNVAKAALQTGVSRVVGISTDKAAQPINVYGTTKMLMERLFQEYALISPDKTKFTLTRYGNVVGSTGSVIPLFTKQFRAHGYVNVTDPYMTRFWISIKQAVDLVKLALDAENGHMIVPKASAMTMGDLALTITNGDNNAIKIIGQRPGEKLHEQMIASHEAVRATDCNSFYDIGTKIVGDTFVLSSNNPQVWIDSATMCHYIAMAESV